MRSTDDRKLTSCHMRYSCTEDLGGINNKPAQLRELLSASLSYALNIWPLCGPPLSATSVVSMSPAFPVWIL